MPPSGIMIFVFICIHLANFKAHEKSKVMLDGHEVYDVYGMVLSRFAGDPLSSLSMFYLWLQLGFI